MLLVVSSLMSIWSIGTDRLMAQSAVTLSVTGPSAPKLSGESFFLRFAYSVSSTTTDAQDVELRLTLPTHVDYIGYSGSSHISHMTDSGGAVTLHFNSTLAAGTAGEVSMRLRFLNGETPNGYAPSFNAALSASNATTSTSACTVTAAATDKISIYKSMKGGGSAGGLTHYKVGICNPNGFGGLTGTNPVVTDVLPTGAEFVEFVNSDAEITASYDAATRTATWILPELVPNRCRNMGITVRFPSPAFSPGQAVENTARLDYAPVGAAAASKSSTARFNLRDRVYSAWIEKRGPNDDVEAGGYGTYQIKTRINGTEPLNNYQITDYLPPEVDVYTVRSGRYVDHASESPVEINLEYQTTEGGGWKSYSGNPIPGTENRSISADDFGASHKGAVSLTALRWNFGNVGIGFAYTSSAEIRFSLRPGTPAGTITNCADQASSTAGATLPSHCHTFNALASLPGNSIGISTDFQAGFDNPFATGDVIALKTTFSNGGRSSINLDDPVATIIIPAGIDFIPGTASTSYVVPELGPASFEYLPNFDGLGNAILRATWPSASEGLHPDRGFDILLKAEVGPLAEGGIDAAVFNASFSGSSPVSECNANQSTDTYDRDGDGDKTDLICNQNFPVTISEFAAISSQLSVRGSGSTEYTTYPQVGQTLPGGQADYRLRIRNEGNVGLTNVKLLDILPHVGDQSVTAASARSSEWTPALVGPVSVPSGVTVYYSTEANPCRAVDGFVASDPPGCQAANWSTSVPDDITTVKSIKIDYSGATLAVGDSIILEWPMRTPTNVLSLPGVSAGDVAWNSAGIVASSANSGTVLPAAEPFKTGISIAPLSPGVVGDRVWMDDGDGIQQATESGLNGVRVELYRDNGDGLPMIESDTYVDFTLTTGDGNYLFPALPTGDYFVLFEVRPTYTLGPVKQGSDPELDSDGHSYYANGRTAAVTDVFRITDTQFDYSRDLALVATGKAAVGDYVWNDADANGQQNEGVSAGINGVTIEMLDAADAVIGSTRTRPDLYGNPGYYQFDNIDPGSVRVRILVPSGTSLSAKQQGGDTTADSDGDPGNGGRTGLITLAAGDVVRDIDFGLQLSGTEECDNGIDDDGDNLIDCQDPDCSGSVLCAPRFACDNTLYQTIKDTSDHYRLYRVEVNPVALTDLVDLTAAGLVGDPNSTVLNPRDGYIYTVDLRSPWAVYRITGDYNVTLVGNLATPPGTYGYNAGAIDRNGNWLVREYTTGEYHIIDLDNLTASVACSFPDAVGQRNVGDLDYNPVDGKYYGTIHASDSLISYDFATCTRDYIRLDHYLTGSTGAFWISASGVGYGYENDNGNLLRINLQTGATDIIDVGPPTAQTDGCSCQGVQLDKDALVRTIRKDEVNTYEFTIANRYVTTLPGVEFVDQLPVGARWVGGPYDMSGGLSFAGVTGIGTNEISFTAASIPQIQTSFKLDYIVDPSYVGPHPMPNQAELQNLPTGIGANLVSDDPTTAAIRDATLVHFYEHCTNGVDDDVDGFTDCHDGECPNANPVLRVGPD